MMLGMNYTHIESMNEEEFNSDCRHSYIELEYHKPQLYELTESICPLHCRMSTSSSLQAWTWGSSPGSPDMTDLHMAMMASTLWELERKEGVSTFTKLYSTDMISESRTRSHYSKTSKIMISQNFLQWRFRYSYYRNQKCGNCNQNISNYQDTFVLTPPNINQDISCNQDTMYLQIRGLKIGHLA